MQLGHLRGGRQGRTLGLSQERAWEEGDHRGALGRLGARHGVVSQVDGEAGEGLEGGVEVGRGPLRGGGRKPLVGLVAVGEAVEPRATHRPPPDMRGHEGGARGDARDRLPGRRRREERRVGEIEVGDRAVLGAALEHPALRRDRAQRVGPLHHLLRLHEALLPLLLGGAGAGSRLLPRVGVAQVELEVSRGAVRLVGEVARGERMRAEPLAKLLHAAHACSRARGQVGGSESRYKSGKKLFTFVYELLDCPLRSQLVQVEVREACLHQLVLRLVVGVDSMDESEGHDEGGAEPGVPRNQLEGHEEDRRDQRHQRVEVRGPHIEHALTDDLIGPLQLLQVAGVERGRGGEVDQVVGGVQHPDARAERDRGTDDVHEAREGGDEGEEDARGVGHPALALELALEGLHRLELERGEHADRRAGDEHGLRVELCEVVHAELQHLPLHAHLARAAADGEELLLGAREARGQLRGRTLRDLGLDARDARARH